MLAHPLEGKGAPRMNGLLSRKQSGGDTPKLSNSTGTSQRLAAKLSELLARLQVGVRIIYLQAFSRWYVPSQQ